MDPKDFECDIYIAKKSWQSVQMAAEIINSIIKDICIGTTPTDKHSIYWILRKYCILRATVFAL